MEKNYETNTKMMKGFPQIRKLGAVSICGESSPFTLIRDGEEHLMRLELYDESHGTDPSFPSVARIRDCETGETLSAFGEGCYYFSLYIEDGIYYVLGTVSQPERTGGDEIRIFWSRDLQNWESRSLLKNPGWSYANTSLTKGDDGYVLLLEAEAPLEFCGDHGFTLFFATSPDLFRWTFMSPDKGFSKERYMGGPFMRFVNGWYYLISVTELPCARYTNYIYRTKDFDTWEVGLYNPILMPDENDRKISPRAYDLTDQIRKEIPTGFISSNSDIDLCLYRGKTLISYNVGNQLGFYYMAEAEYDGTPEEFFEAYFD